MIYVTVGTQLPFARLIKAVNDVAAEKGLDVFAQIGPDKSHYHAIKTADFVDPEDATRLIQEADLVIAHAGMGTIITASQYGKPLIIMPRHFQFGEHRNDHQIATARRFQDFSNITVVDDKRSLADAVNLALETVHDKDYLSVSQYAPDAFVTELKKLLV
ncbi:glycosyltransferase [Thalassolituus sp.]|uniref:glycosyltransferase n=1 Tax=Thalassolituus sp. TaxID=2030822 RepID=UPI003514343A